MAKKLLLIILTLSLKLNIFSQIVILGDSTNVSYLELNECGKSDTFTSYIRVATGSLTGTIKFTDSFLNDFVVTDYLYHASILSVSGLGTNKITFTLDNSIVNASGTTGIYLQYLAKAKCGANGLNETPHFLNLTANSFNQNKTGQDFVSGVKAPTIVIDARNNVNNSNAVIGQTYTRFWRLRNTGTQSTLDTIFFKVIYQLGTSYNSLIIDGVPSTPDYQNGDTVLFKIIKTLRNQSIFVGDTIIIEEKYTVTSCTNSNENSHIISYFTCNNLPVCEVKDVFANTQIPNLVPQITSKVFLASNGCYNAYENVQLMYINTGQGNASNVRIRFDQSYPLEGYTWPNPSSISFIDTASIRIKTGINGTYSKIAIDSVVNYGFSRPFWPVSNPVATVYLRPGDIKSNDTIFVQFSRFRAEYNDILCSNTENYINASSTYTNICNTAQYVYPKTNIWGQAHRYYGKTGYNGPAYLTNNDSGRFEFSTVRGASFNHHISGNTHKLMIQINLPNGLSWNGDTVSLRLTNVGRTYNKKCDSTYYDLATNTLQVFYKNPNAYGGLFIRPYFKLNCSSASAGSNKISIQYFNVDMVSTCLGQKVPLSCKDEYPITLICGGPCPRGGVSGTFAQIRRVNFGMVDNDNNGIPDGSGAIDFDKVEWNKMAPRDTFILTYKGRVSRGSQSPSANFEYGYGNVYFPQYANLIQVLKGDITVYDNSSGTSFTVNNLPFSRFDTSTRSRIEFNYSANVAGFPGGYYYDNADSFTFVGRFVFNPNVVESSVTDNTVTIDNKFFVSHYANPTSDTARYRCLYLPSNFRVVQVYKGYNGGFVTRPSGCSQAAMYSDYFQSVGDCCSNYAGSMHFPFEYRLFTTLDTIRVRIPTGYTLDSTNIRYVYTTGAGNAASKMFYTLSPISINGEWHTFLLTPFYNFAGGTQVPSTTGSYWQMYNFIRPSCQLAVGTVHTQFTADRWIGRDLWTGITTRGVANNHNRGTITYENAAQLDIKNFGPSVQNGINQVVSWDVQIQNNALVGASNNTWLAFRNSANKIIVDSVRDLSNNTLLTQVNGIYRAGTINAAGAFKNYRVFAKYSTCISDSLKVYTGWTCSAYPNTFAATSGSCRADSTQVYLVPINPLIQTDLIQTPPIISNLCDTLTWVVSVSNRQIGTAYGTSLEFRIPNGGVGAILLPGSQYKYPHNTGTYTNITPINLTGGRYLFRLSDSIPQINANGLRPIDEAPNNEILLKVRMITNCNYVSGSSVRFIARGNRACGTALTPDAEFNPIRIAGAPGPKLLIAAGVSGDIKPCNKPIKVNLSLNNLELSPASLNDSMIVILPSNVRYLHGSLNYLRNAFTQGEPNIMMVGDRQRLSWCPLPLGGFDSSVLEMNIQSDENTACGTNAELETISISTYIANCAATICKSSIQNSYDSKNVPVFKPDLKYVPGTGLMKVVSDSFYNPVKTDSIVLTNLQFINSGNDTALAPKLTFFYDVNNNDKLDITDIVFKVDTMSYLEPANSFIYNKVFTFPNKTLIDTVKIWLRQDCNCDQTEIPIYAPYRFIELPVNFISFEVTKISNFKAKLYWTIADENSQLNYFEIYRSIDGVSFEKINVIYANKNHSFIDNYTYFDNISNLSNGRVFYKIKAVSKTSNIKWTELKSILLNNDLIKSINIYPNPATNNVNINIIEDENSSNDNKYNIEVFDINGKLLFNLMTSQKSNELNLSDFASGIYFVKISSNEFVYHSTIDLIR